MLSERYQNTKEQNAHHRQIHRDRIREGDAKTETQVRVIQGHRPRHVGGLSEAGKGKETDYSLEPLKKCSLANPF